MNTLQEDPSASTGRTVVMVIGGSSGMGLGVAKTALRDGADVVIVGRSTVRLEQAVAVLGPQERLRTAAADISDEDQVGRLFDETGLLDHVVVTAADIAGYQPLRELDLAAARRVIDSKLVGALLVARYAAPRLRPGGSITLTGGIAAERPVPGGSVVAAVNSALIGLTRALALELAPIRVNVLAPGWVDTPFWDTMAGPRKAAILDGMAARLPVGRIGRTEDIGQAALYAMRAGHLTGAVLQVDGGQRLV
jgi:NAD(P)-dependent dehydrogenase (short-subunit alcohol dehydrogenase family)